MTNICSCKRNVFHIISMHANVIRFKSFCYITRSKWTGWQDKQKMFEDSRVSCKKVTKIMHSPNATHVKQSYNLLQLKVPEILLCIFICTRFEAFVHSASFLSWNMIMLFQSSKCFFIWDRLKSTQKWYLNYKCIINATKKLHQQSQFTFFYLVYQRIFTPQNTS